MKPVIPPILSLLLALPSLASAEFQDALAYSYTKDSEKNGFTATTSAHNVRALHYLQAVSAPGKPYDLEPFFDPKSYISAGASKLYFNDGVTLRSTLVNLSAGWYHESGTYLFADILTGDGDIGGSAGSFSASGSQNQDAFEIGIGSYLNAHSRIEYIYRSISTDTTLNTSFLSMTESDTVIHELSLEHVTLMSDNTHMSIDLGIQAWNTSSSTSVDEDNTIVSVDLTYYPDQMTGIGLSLRTGSGDDEDRNRQRLSLELSHFVSYQLGIIAAIGQTKAESSFSADESSIGFGAVYRY